MKITESIINKLDILRITEGSSGIKRLVRVMSSKNKTAARTLPVSVKGYNKIENSLNRTKTTKDRFRLMKQLQKVKEY